MLFDANPSGDTSYASPFILSRIANGLNLWRKRALYRLSSYLLTRQKITLWLFAILRRIRSIFIFGDLVIVSRHDDVVAVLNRSRDFELGEFARPRMLAGEFILDIDWPRSHHAQQTVLRNALLGCGSVLNANIVASVCANHVNQDNARLDVTGLARVASMEVVAKYYGVTCNVDEKDDLADRLTELAAAIILLPPSGTAERQIVDQAADELRTRVRELIEKRKSALSTAQTTRSTPDDLLSRLVVETRASHAPDWLKEEWVGRMICGLTVFGMATVVRTATDVVDELLDRPAALASAIQAATNAESDAASLKGHIYEALRFRPMLPVLARYCPRTTVVGSRDKRRRIVKAGATVWAPPLAAMHDPNVFPNPSKFQSDRPLKNYLVFGTGLHKCIGQAFADAALTEIVGSVLRRPGLHRLPGKMGRIKYQGAAAAQFLVGIDG